MKIDQENFAQLVNKAMQVENVSHMRSVIEKELLHYDILFALEKGPNSTAKCDTRQYQAANAISLNTIAGCLKPKHFLGR